MVIRRAGTNSDMLGAVQSMLLIGCVVLVVVGGREAGGCCWLETALEGVNMTRASTRSSTRVKLVPEWPASFPTWPLPFVRLMSVALCLHQMPTETPCRRGDFRYFILAAANAFDF